VKKATVRALLIARNGRVEPDILLMPDCVRTGSVSAHAVKLSHLLMCCDPSEQTQIIKPVFALDSSKSAAHNVRFSRLSSNRNIENP
jgi:hypothetical protein